MQAVLELRVATDKDVESLRQVGFMYFEYSMIANRISPQPFFMKKMNKYEAEHFRDLFTNAQIYIPKNLTEIIVRNDKTN
nr:hypothetical protein [uncultured Flavobacterium sp.]